MDEVRAIKLQEIRFCIQSIHDELLELVKSNVNLIKKRKRVYYLTSTSRLLIDLYIDVLNRS